jgi:hypothetical protein
MLLFASIGYFQKAHQKSLMKYTLSISPHAHVTNIRWNCFFIEIYIKSTTWRHKTLFRVRVLSVLKVSQIMRIFPVTVIIRIYHHDLSPPYHTLTIKIIVIIVILLTGNQYALCLLAYLFVTNSKIIKIMNISHRPVFSLKLNFSDIWFCLRFSWHLLSWAQNDG